MWTSALPLSSYLSSSLALPLYPARVRQRLLQWRTQGRVPGGPPPVIFRPNWGPDGWPPGPPPTPWIRHCIVWKGKGKFVFNSVIKYDYRWMWKHVKKAVAKTQFLKLASFLFQAMNWCSMACRGLGPALPLLEHNRDEGTGPKGRNNSSGNLLTMTFHTFLTVNRS